MADRISFADQDIGLKSQVTVDKFSRKNRFQCTFCFGGGCVKEKYTKCKEPIIEGLHSNMIENKIIGSQRPSFKLIEKFNVIN